jgi:phosphopantothenoylcysteine decarboxylase/phosphopantothenate--cysteine ligase
MGFALAGAAAARGARVILVHGPTSVAPPLEVERVPVQSALEMHAAVFAALPSADAVVMTAAVADYRPAEARTEKIKKSSDHLTLELVKNPDILADLGKQRGRGRKPVLVGFAMETNDLLAYARRKLVQKRCDLIVANEAEVAGRDDTQVTLVGPDGDEPLPPMAKRELADRILDRITALLGARPALKPKSPKGRRPRARGPARRPKGR